MKALQQVVALVFIFNILLQPVVPVLEYMAFRKYIIENLCENRNKPKSCCKGKCFLKKQLKEANSESQEKGNPGEKPNQKVIELNLPPVEFLLGQAHASQHGLKNYSNTYHFPFSSQCFRPLKFYTPIISIA